MREKKIEDLIHRKLYSQAKIELDRWLQEDAKNPEVFYLMGVLEYFQGKVSPTIQNLKRSLELDPKHTDAAICLSVLLNDLGRYEEAKKVFDQANQSVLTRVTGVVTAIDQKFAAKHLELGDLYFRYRRYDEAIEEYSKSSLLNPNNIDVQIRRAKSYARKGFVSRALQDLQVLKHEHPQHLATRLQLGLLHFSQSNMIDAELEWEEVLRLAPNNQEAKNYLSDIRSRREDASFSNPRYSLDGRGSARDKMLNY